MQIRLKFGVIDLGFEEFIVLLALSARSVCYMVVSSGLNYPSGFGCLWGKSENVYVSIVQFVPVWVRSRVSTSLGVPILEVAHSIASCAGHLRGPASRSAFVVSGCHMWPDKSVWIASCRLIGLHQPQVSCSLPILSLLALMDSFWPLPLTTLQSISSQSCGYWTRVPRLTWNWGSSSLSWLVGVTVLCYPYCLNLMTLLPCPTGRMCSLVTAHNILFDYLCWIFVTLVHYTLSLLLVMNSFALIRIFFLLSSLIESALRYHPPFRTNSPGMIELPCFVFWTSLARTQFCTAIAYLGLRYTVSLSCNFRSLQLTMVLFRCTQQQYCRVHLPTDLMLVQLNASLTIVLVKPTLNCGWVLAYMMRLLSSIIATWVVVIECCGLPLFWLSLPLERLFALRQEPLWSRICWQLRTFQIGRDEVKGKILVVDEELLSETSFATLFEVSRGVCRVEWCFLMQVCGPGVSGCCERPSRLIVYFSSSHAPANSGVAVQFLLSCVSAMYWSHDVMVNCSPQLVSQVTVVLNRVSCIDSHPTNCISGCCTFSDICCHSNIIRILEQRLCVLGLCLQALEMHH